MDKWQLSAVSVQRVKLLLAWSLPRTSLKPGGGGCVQHKEVPQRGRFYHHSVPSAGVAVNSGCSQKGWWGRLSLCFCSWVFILGRGRRHFFHCWVTAQRWNVCGCYSVPANAWLPSWTLLLRKSIFLLDSVSASTSSVQMQKRITPVPSDCALLGTDGGFTYLHCSPWSYPRVALLQAESRGCHLPASHPAGLTVCLGLLGALRSASGAWHGASASLAQHKHVLSLHALLEPAQNGHLAVFYVMPLSLPEAASHSWVTSSFVNWVLHIGRSIPGTVVSVKDKKDKIKWSALLTNMLKCSKLVVVGLAAGGWHKPVVMPGADGQ